MAAATPIIETGEAQVAPLRSGGNSILAQAHDIVISDQGDYEGAAEFLRTCKTMEKRVKDTFDEPVRKAHEAHKAIVAVRSELLGPIESAEKIAKRKMAAYADEQERIAAEARRKAEAEARRVAEEAQLRDAAELEARGDSAAAEETLSAPIVVPLVATTIAKPVAEGTSTRKKYRAEVTDFLALLKAAAEGRIPSGLVIANQQALDGLASSLKESFAIPGVTLRSETVIAARGR